MEITLEWLRLQVQAGQYEFSSHAEEERQTEKISVEDVENAILKGEILEDYPEDRRGHSCLVLGYGNEGYPIHIVCGKTPSDKMRIITVYIPSLPKWVDERNRRR